MLGVRRYGETSDFAEECNRESVEPFPPSFFLLFSLLTPPSTITLTRLFRSRQLRVLDYSITDVKPQLNTSSYVNVYEEPEEQTLALKGLKINLADQTTCTNKRADASANNLRRKPVRNDIYILKRVTFPPPPSCCFLFPLAALLLLFLLLRHL